MKITNDISKEIYELAKNTSQVLTNQQIADKFGITEGTVRHHIKKWERNVHEIAKNDQKVHAAVANNTLDVIAESLKIIQNIKKEIYDSRNFGGDPARVGSLYAQWIKALELAAKLLGDLKGPDVQVNIQVNQQFNEFMQVVLSEVDDAAKARIRSKLKEHI